MMDNKTKSQYSENLKRQLMAAIKDMEKYPSPMTPAFTRPAYDGTVACPDPDRREKNRGRNKGI